MTTEENKALIRKFCDEAFNKGKPQADFFVPDRPLHRPWGDQPGAISNIHAEVLDQVAEGDKVTTRWRATFTHSGEFRTPWGSVIPASGKQLSLTWLSIDRIAGGKIAESWVEGDWAGVLQQLGAIPAPAAT